MKARAAVIGAGYLGRFHAEKYATLPDVELTAVVDIVPSRAAALAGEWGASALDHHAGLDGRVDIASVVVPTAAHFDIARDLLDRGIHVLLEKPMTTTIAQARELIDVAERRGAVLQVGHLERYNSAMVALAGQVHSPLFIEAHRIAPFRPRGTDVDVILDLMIHDIDLVQEIVAAPIERIDANGAPVLSGQIDVANARLRFAGGCVANLTASRVGLKSQRQLRLFQRDAYFSADLANHILKVRRRGDPRPSGEQPAIEEESITTPGNDALLDEIRDFVASARGVGKPAVTGRDGLRAVEAAAEITRQLGVTPGHEDAASGDQRAVAEKDVQRDDQHRH